MKPLMIEMSRINTYLNADGFDFEVVENIAIIPVYGFLTKRFSQFADFLGTTSYEEIAENLQAALDNPLVEKIIFDVDSPGGEVNGIFDLCDKIYAARQGKTIEAIANDDAFSAAYAIASSASKLWITRTSGVGSVGVIATHFDQSVFNANEGFKVTPIFAGSHKNDWTPHEAISDGARAAMQDEIDRLYALFVETVARNRGVSAEKIRATEAALFFGDEAVNAGLADGFRTRNALIASFSKARKVNEKNSLMTINKKDPEKLLDFFCVNKRRDEMENEKIEEIAIEDEVENGEIVEEPNDQQNGGTPEFAARVNELVKLCKIAKRPELLADWLERNMTVADAQAALLKELEAQDVEIVSAKTVMKMPENPLIMAAKNRVAFRH
jgi:signal peptide peptidase SppA